MEQVFRGHLEYWADWKYYIEADWENGMSENKGFKPVDTYKELAYLNLNRRLQSMIWPTNATGSLWISESLKAAFTSSKQTLTTYKYFSFPGLLQRLCQPL